MLADGAHRYNAIHSGKKNLNIFSRALHAFSMADEEWRVADLLDEEQPIVADAKLAKQIVEVLGALDETNLDVRVPKAAREFAENTLSEWFEIIAEIEKKRGNIPYLINRELYQPGTDGAPDWDQGLRLEDWKQWLSDPDFMEAFYQHFHLTKLHKSTKDETPLSGYYNRIFPVKFVCCGYWLLTPSSALTRSRMTEQSGWKRLNKSLLMNCAKKRS